jgi:methylenetetrahydrofolate dehydrogenase (NADP+)/methenyltetrahydrofolate cyclohydrolase
MILLDGKSLSQEIISGLHFVNTSLHVILIGDDPSSLKYVSLKQKICLEVGVNFTLHHLKDDSTLPNLINQLNNDPTVDGFFIQLPIKNKELLKLIDPSKDVDGLNPQSSFTPAVVIGIIKLLEHYHLDFTNKKIVIVNDSDLVGKPLKKHFNSAILCNDQISNLSAITQTADLLISATGVKNIITADMVKSGAVVVDVANGDVEFTNVAPKCSYITPTFGGIGPMTIASLLYNLSLIKINHG